MTPTAPQPAPAAAAAALGEDGAPSALEQERDRLRNALAQLERSNAELRRELDAQRAQGAPLDRDYKEALEDNLVVVAKYRARVAALEEEIRRVKAGGGDGAAGAPPRDVGGLGVGVEGARAGRDGGSSAAGAAAAAGGAAAAGAATAAAGEGAGGGGSGGGGNENEAGGVWI